MQCRTPLKWDCARRPWKVKKLIFALFPIVLGNCSTSKETTSPEKKAECLVFSHAQSFAIFPLFSPCANIDEKKVFNTIVKSLNTIGETTVSSEKPLLESLEMHSKAPMIGLLSIGKKTEGALEANLKIASQIKAMTNECSTISLIWEKTILANFPDPTSELTEAFERLATAIIEEFGKEYALANPNGQKPFFEIRRAIDFSSQKNGACILKK